MRPAMRHEEDGLPGGAAMTMEAGGGASGSGRRVRMAWRARQGRAGVKMGECGGHFEAPASK
jgi:hypothetical protein